MLECMCQRELRKACSLPAPCPQPSGLRVGRAGGLPRVWPRTHVSDSEIKRNSQLTTTDHHEPEILISSGIQLALSSFSHSNHTCIHLFTLNFLKREVTGRLTSGCKFAPGIHLPGSDRLSSEPPALSTQDHVVFGEGHRVIKETACFVSSPTCRKIDCALFYKDV